MRDSYLFGDLVLSN